MTVRLEPMGASAWEAWRASALVRYAADMVRTGAWPADGAIERAESEFAQLAPGGQETPGHEFRAILDEAGDVVGSLWFAGDDRRPETAFIWDLFVEEPHRGNGHGRAAMAALEPLARSLGYGAIRLHVFGDNPVARNLYRSTGYAEIDVTMVKRIA